MVDFLTQTFNDLADFAAWVMGRRPLTTEAAVAFGIWFVWSVLWVTLLNVGP